MRSTVLAALPVLVLACAAGLGAPDPDVVTTGRTISRVVDYTAPLPEPLHVTRGFDPPAGPYAPGHRGVDLAASHGAVVHSAADGVVSFAGAVAGRGVVVVAHADGVRTEYEPVAPGVHTGAAVRRGDPIGTVSGRHLGCSTWCLHWGARRGGTYLDPLTLLRRLGPVRLLPWPRDG